MFVAKVTTLHYMTKLHAHYEAADNLGVYGSLCVPMDQQQQRDREERRVQAPALAMRGGRRIATSSITTMDSSWSGPKPLVPSCPGTTRH